MSNDIFCKKILFQLKQEHLHKMDKMDILGLGDSNKELEKKGWYKLEEGDKDLLDKLLEEQSILDIPDTNNSDTVLL